jgi:hypothetical protein
METFIQYTLTFNIDNYKFYNNLYPWIDNNQIKKIFKVKKDKKKYSTNAILFNNIYLLTPYIYEYGVNYSVNGIECELLFKSFEYKLNLFVIKGQLKSNGINIYDIKKNIPNDNEKLEYIDSSCHNLISFAKKYINIPNKTYQNIYYIVDNIPIGIPIYQNNNLIGISISHTKIINIFSIYNFLKEIIEFKSYSGFFTLYYTFDLIDDKLTKIKNNYNISYNKESNINRNNLQINDILLEIDGFPIHKNTIDHTIFGIINIFSFVLLKYTKNDIIKMKILRENKLLSININTRSIYSIESIETNNNKSTEYRITDEKIYYELNFWMITNLIFLGYKIPKSIKYLIINENINNDKEYGYRLVLKYNIKSLDINLDNIITIINKKEIRNIKDID